MRERLELFYYDLMEVLEVTGLYDALLLLGTLFGGIFGVFFFARSYLESTGMVVVGNIPVSTALYLGTVFGWCVGALSMQFLMQKLKGRE